MNTYHKIQTIYKRDPATNHKTLLDGEYSLPVFSFLRENEWVFTEKVDGTNIRVVLQNGDLSFKGKTDRAQIPGNLVKRLSERFTKEKMVTCFHDAFDGVCLYGEGYGPKIQSGGGNYRDDQDFVLFDVKVGPWWLERSSVEEIAKELDIDVVPIIGTGTLDDMVDMCRKGFKSQWGDFNAEGIVARPVVELTDRSGRRVITKLKLKDFARN